MGNFLPVVYQPHERPPAIVDAEPRHVARAAVDDTLAELPIAQPVWWATGYLRAMIASTGPIVVSSPSLSLAARARFDAARWPVVDAQAASSDESIARVVSSFWPSLTALRAVGWGVGCAAPNVVVVGEREKIARGLPFLSRGGSWLMRALRVLGYDECSIYWTNAQKGTVPMDAEIAEIERVVRRYEPTILAVGVTAHTTLSRLGIKHVRAESPVVSIKWRRANGPQGYAAHLAGVGMPHGPWRGEYEQADQNLQPLPTIVAASPPSLLDVYGLPADLMPERLSEGESEKGRTARSSVRSAIAERARRLYVTGEASTVREAAQMVGLKPERVTPLLDIARTQEWDRERADHEHRVRAKVYEAAADAEAHAITMSRRMAGANLMAILKKISDGVAKNTMNVRVHDAESMAKTLALLSDRGDPSADQEVERLKALPLLEQMREMNARLRAQYGDDVLDGSNAEGSKPSPPAPAKPGDTTKGATK